MTAGSDTNDATNALRQINEAWLAGRVDAMAPLLHPEIVMVFPGFAGKIQGREELLAGFRDFCEHATVHEFREHDHQVDAIGDTAVLSFRYEMLYERSGKRNRATGRDLWVFQKLEQTWTAVWRTMLDMTENPAPLSQPERPTFVVV